ncbi:hypothetical protein H5T87_05585 [bacterium]|nr:hypothetical protein [bacterium]
MKWEEFLEAVKEKFSPFQGLVTYGNLRWESHNWGEGEDSAYILSLVYETPGGSTNQFSVYYRPATDTFEALGQEQEEDLRTSSVSEVLAWLEDKVRKIPQIRIAKLKSNIDQWFASGRTRMEMLQEMNKLLQTDFKGGSITHTELREGIQYILSLLGKDK